MKTKRNLCFFLIAWVACAVTAFADESELASAIAARVKQATATPKATQPEGRP